MLTVSDVCWGELGTQMNSKQHMARSGRTFHNTDGFYIRCCISLRPVCVRPVCLPAPCLRPVCLRLPASPCACALSVCLHLSASPVCACACLRPVCICLCLVCAPCACPAPYQVDA